MKRIAIALAVTTLFTGCGQSVIQGVVEDMHGESLPGVSVKVAGRDQSALTDARGKYLLRHELGMFQVVYAKSGYTTFQADLYYSESAINQQPTVQLWPVPPKEGVFHFTGTRYDAVDQRTFRKYFLSDGTIEQALRELPDRTIAGERPLLLCFKTPRRNAKLARLQEVEAHLPTDPSQTFGVWIAGGSVPVDLIPVVVSDPSLLQVRLIEPLQPGMYALHWGALEGYTSLDERIFIFIVTAEPTVDLTDFAPGDVNTQKKKHEPKEGDSP
jgi:hypothetical protein